MNLKKYHYSKKRYSNPFFAGRNKKRLKLPALNWKLKLILISATVGLIALSWFLLLSDYFIIKTVDIEGAEKISPAELTDLVWRQTDNNKYLFFSEKNIFIFNQAELTGQLNRQYGLDELIIKKKIPDSIKIIIKEKAYTLIWLEEEKYYYIDDQGYVFNQADIFSLEQQHYPLLDNQGSAKLTAGKIDYPDTSFQFIDDLYKQFNSYNKQQYPIERFIIDDEVNTVKLKIISGPLIYFNLNDRPEKQLNKLFILLEEKIKDDFSNKSYIDLRYGDRVYYR